MANHRSIVIIVSVKMDKCEANTVRNPAVWQPKPILLECMKVNSNIVNRIIHVKSSQNSPYCQSKAKLKYSPMEWISIEAINSK